jgi:putative flippase GtrA
MTRWARFAGVGFMGFCVQLATLQTLTALLDMHFAVAVVLSVEAAILHNFIWHERWTWRDRVVGSRSGTSLARLARFNAACGAVSLVGNVAFTAFFVSLIGLPVIVANVAAIVCLTAINFVVADRAVFQTAAAVMGLLAVLAGSGRPLHAADLRSATVAGWDRYVSGVEARRALELRDPLRFLSVDFSGTNQRDTLRLRLGRGEIPIESIGASTLDGAGTISHWRGYVFVPGAGVGDLVDCAALRGRCAERHHEDVIEQRVLDRNGDSLRLFLKLRRQAIVTVAYNTEHLVSYQRHSAERASSRSVSTRIAELQDAGTPREREQPVGQDRGFLWRLHSYWRYEAAPGGVIVELESLTLSRAIPWAVRPVAGPIVDVLARESMTRTLASLRALWVNRSGRAGQ